MSATIRPHWGAKQVLAYGLIAAVSLFVMVRYLQAVHASAVQQYAGACASLQPEVITDRAAPAFDLKDVAGKRTRLAALRGKPVLVNFWATWCPPCKDELPALLDFAAEAEARVLAVSLDPDWDAVRRFLGPDLPPPVLRADSDTVAQAFDVRSLPVTFVIDAGGQLKLRLDGPRGWASPGIRAQVRDAGRR